ncbi:MAG: ribosome-associated translation inhibitor RaiA [Dehalococcoidales bacterium]|nr:ribosome-associated translation inhibitor RaiA [Dehalococcoidales bacterium]
MDIQITGKNIEIQPAAWNYMTKKLDKINKFLPGLISFDVEASEEKTRDPGMRYIVQVTLDNKGTLIRGEERGQDIYTATDKVLEVMNRQIEHLKGKKPHSRNKGNPSIRTSPLEESVSQEPGDISDEPRIVKTKKFDVKPMSLEEAVDQMELLGHDFFLFFNPDDNLINLIYRRKDGNYGLIVPVTR